MTSTTKADHARARAERLAKGIVLNPLNPDELPAIERVGDALRRAAVLEGLCHAMATEEGTPGQLPHDLDPWDFWQGLYDQCSELRRLLDDIHNQAHDANHVNAECER